MNSSIRIVFMGTPEFAVSSLDALIEKGYNVVGVITAPDKAAGRGQHVHVSAVKQYAEKKGLHILQPPNLKDEEFLKTLDALKADLQIVVAFRMLPESVWGMPPKGTINLHASLLPDYRGAAPINRAIMNGDTETGLTTFFIEKEIDTGKILLQDKVQIPGDWTAGQLHDELMGLTGKLLIKTIELIQSGSYNAVDQATLIESGKTGRPAPKIFKEDCKIQWGLPNSEVYNHVRGLNPYPTAWSELVSPDGEKHGVKIFECSKGNGGDGKAGSISTDRSRWEVNCGEGSVIIDQMQLAGKKRMNATDFLRGFKLDNKWTFQ